MKSFHISFVDLNIPGPYCERGRYQKIHVDSFPIIFDPDVIRTEVLSHLGQ